MDIHEVERVKYLSFFLFGPRETVSGLRGLTPFLLGAFQRAKKNTRRLTGQLTMQWQHGWLQSQYIYFQPRHVGVTSSRTNIYIYIYTHTCVGGTLLLL